MVRGLLVLSLALALIAATVYAAPMSAIESTSVDVRDRADLDRGETALFPVRIANDGSRTATYDLALTGTDGWATWRVDPDARFTLQPRSEIVRYVRLETDADAMGGTRTVTLAVTSGDDVIEIPLRVYVRAPQTVAQGWIPAFQSTLLFLLLLLTLFAVSIAARRMRRRGPSSPVAKPESGRTERVEVVDLEAARAPTPKATSVKAPASRRRTVAVERAPSDERHETHY